MSTSQSLYLTEIFLSIQGETSLTGCPTTFIRLSGCNLRCSWCDTAYSFKRGTLTSLDSILETVKKNGASFVCVTGGEPLLQKNVFPLISQLIQEGFTVSVETGGSLPLTPLDPLSIAIVDIKCPQSLMSHKNNYENLLSLREQDEVKFVVQDREDYLFAKEIAKKYSLFKRKKHPLLSPVFDKLDPKILIDWFLEDKLPFRLNLQLHKYIWEPLTRGV